MLDNKDILIFSGVYNPTYYVNVIWKIHFSFCYREDRFSFCVIRNIYPGEAKNSTADQEKTKGFRP
jgi:hypothetical protein